MRPLPLCSLLSILLASLLLLSGCASGHGGAEATFPTTDDPSITQAVTDRVTAPPESTPLLTDDDLRQSAALLSEKHGIEILFASPDLSLPMATLLPCNDPQQLRAMLDGLAQVLALYPDGFFPALLSRSGRATFRLILCGGILVQDMATAGLFSLQGNRMLLILDATQTMAENRIHHELSHAIEAALEKSLSAEHPLYTAFGPGGYLHSYEGYREATAFTFVGESDPERVYFLSPYSKTYPQEDRAELFALLMQSPDSPAFASRHLRGKLRAYLSAIEEGLRLDGASPVWQAHFEAIEAKWE